MLSSYVTVVAQSIVYYYQCSTCKNTYAGIVQAFYADIKQGWLLFIGEWFTLKCLMGIATGQD